MTRYLISFPSDAMDHIPRRKCRRWPGPHTRSSRKPKTPVYLFTGGLEEDVEPVMVTHDGTVTAGTYPADQGAVGRRHRRQRATREAALEWAAKSPWPAAAVRKRSGSSCSTRWSDRSAPMANKCFGAAPHITARFIGMTDRWMTLAAGQWG